MKTRFAVALIGLAISFAMPILAQQRDTIDPQFWFRSRHFAFALWNQKYSGVGSVPRNGDTVFEEDKILSG
jgi:hypothetical protein